MGGSTGRGIEEGGVAQSQSGEAKLSKAREATSGGTKCRVHHETWVLHRSCLHMAPTLTLNSSHPILLTHLYKPGCGIMLGIPTLPQSFSPSF